MKAKILVPIIAFIVACAALIFSIVTFIRTLIRGELVWIGALQVTGTALIVGVCAITIYLAKSSDYEEEDESLEDNEYDSHEITDKIEENTDENIEESNENTEDSPAENAEQEEPPSDENLLSDLPKVDE